MTTPAAGWYPDPHQPDLMRWWDGAAWSTDTYERVARVGGLLDETPATTRPQPGGQQPGQPAAGPPGQHGTVQPYAGAAGPTSAGPVTATEDGVPLAAWGLRLAARVIDTLVLLPFTLLLSWNTIGGVVSHLLDVSRQQQVSGTFDPLAVYDQRTLRDVAVISLIGLGLSLVYELAFLLWRAATPGKLLLGLRVRRWRAGEPLSAAVVARRWLGYQGLGQVLGAPWTLIDCLWPLWDRRRQALHDKVAGTCVVRSSTAEATTRSS